MLPAQENADGGAWLCRAALMEEGRASAPARETMSTADLDNRGLLQLQQGTMSRQDNELEELERSVNSTKVRALTIPMSAWSDPAGCLHNELDIGARQ